MIADNALAHTHEPPFPAGSNVSPCVEDQLALDVDDYDSKPVRLPKILRESQRPITLKFEDVSYSLKLMQHSGGCLCHSAHPKPARTVLKAVSGLVRPGEILAMLGPSGSGKTTLLAALAGRLPGKFSGKVTYNGDSFSSRVKRAVGYVTQDDVLYPHLTVAETLTYTALLRLPRQFTLAEKLAQVESIVAELGLSRCRNSVIGSALFRGVSGGERKRVSIGQEMVVNPSLLLLDEPTSGLDSTTAQRIVLTLRELARGGRTVVTTIHQPSSRLYMMFDEVVVLSDGCPIYSGHADRVMEYFGSIGFVPRCNYVNPADFVLDLANGLTPETNGDDAREVNVRSDDQTTAKQSLVSSYRKNLDPALKSEIRSNLPDPVWSAAGLSGLAQPWATNWWTQFHILLARGLRERRHESYSGLRVFQILSVSILAGLLWWGSDPNHLQDQVGLLFFFSIFWGFFPLFNAIFSFPQERPMIARERASGMYHLSSYFFARMAGDLPMELVLPTLFTAITYWMGGLKPCVPTFLLTLLIVLLNVLVSQGLGLALGAILMDVKQGTTLASVTMLVFLLAGGYYIQHIPVFIRWLKYVSFSHYCYKLLVGVQYSAGEIYSCGDGGMSCRVSDFPAIRTLGIHGLWWDVAALVVMLVGYRLLAYVALRMRPLH